MKKKFIKMNDSKNYLSLGNLFNIIKKHSKVQASAIQSELFCVIFNIKEINKTTVNNYLIGYRPISLDYKKIYIDLKSTYTTNKNIFVSIITNILNILDEKIYDNYDLNDINNNNSLKKVCKDLIIISKTDDNVSNELIKKIEKLYESNDLYSCFIEILFYTILDNIQPVYIDEIEININDNELKEYLKINLYEGISYISSLQILSKKDNKYANAELGSLEFSGVISGKKDYEKSFNYYMKASTKNHPKACWMVANLILTDKVKCKDITLAWEYLEKAVKLGSIAAINTMGNCYLNGKNKNNIIDEEKALEYFLQASEYSYSYSYNNIGLYYERKNNFIEALNYFKLSADLNNSWALNKVGEYYRKNNDLNTAYFYYLKSIETPINERNWYGYYNLSKYYYYVGNEKLGIKKDLDKAKYYMDIFLNK